MKRHLLIAGILAICVTLLVPAGAFAAGSGSGETEVSGTLVTSYTLVPPDAISLGDIDTIGVIDMGPYNITVSTNDSSVTTCGVSVADKDAALKGGNVGKLTDGTATPHYLGTALMVSGGTLGNSVLSSSRELLSASTPIGSASITNFHVLQNIVANDFLNPGAYTITLTFTATFQ